MITIDEKNGTLAVTNHSSRRTYQFSDPEAFRIVSDLWLRVGWDNKYVYSFTWLGRPIIQLPEDMFRIQELVFSLRPDFIVETGVAHGGSLVFYASLCHLLGQGRVIGVDIDIRPHNRQAIERHPLFPYIDLVEGNSVDPAVFEQVKELIGSGDKTVLVILDSCHNRDHVLHELRLYCQLVSLGSYIIPTDGIMASLVGAPRSQPDWSWNNPLTAIRCFLAENNRFAPEEPVFPFNEGNVSWRITYWPSCFLKRHR
ncbi:MAG: cephalosporin hydroxylase family protein [Negativicutes bacterium]|nr:cephalosporin hydroxylase family protein [Negativicutes bacterium]